MAHSNQFEQKRKSHKGQKLQFQYIKIDFVDLAIPIRFQSRAVSAFLRFLSPLTDHRYSCGENGHQLRKIELT